MISGKTTLIAHLGYPTESIKAPMIYNPWFEKSGIDAVIMPGKRSASDPTFEAKCATAADNTPAQIMRRSIAAVSMSGALRKPAHSVRADYKSIGTINQGRARTISAHRDPDDTSDWTVVDFD